MDTFSEVRDAIIQTIGSDFSLIKPESELEGGLGLDSLDIIEMTIVLEDRLNIELDSGYSNKWSTVKDIMQAVDEQLKVKQNG